MTTTDPNHGRFVWYDLMTTDPKGAIEFYTKVTGWKTQPFEGSDYMMFVSSQGPLGGVTMLPETAKKMGAGPFWQANVEVPDVGATVEQVKKMGGQLYVSEEVPSVGRFAVVADPLDPSRRPARGRSCQRAKLRPQLTHPVGLRTARSAARDVLIDCPRSVQIERPGQPLDELLPHALAIHCRLARVSFGSTGAGGASIATLDRTRPRPVTGSRDHRTSL